MNPLWRVVCFTAAKRLHDFSLIYPVDEFSLNEIRMWGQSKISSHCFKFCVNQKNQETVGVQDSLV